MRIFRSEAALLDDSMRRQVLDLFIVRMLERREQTDPFTLVELGNLCDGPATQSAMLDVVVGLLEDKILTESEDGRLTLLQPNRAQIEAGLFTEDTLDLVPEGVQVFGLADEVVAMVEEKGMDEACAELAQRIAADEAAKLN